MLKTFLICQAYFAIVAVCCFALCRARGLLVRSAIGVVWAGVMLTASYAVWIEPASAHRSMVVMSGGPSFGAALPLAAIGRGDP